MIKTLIIFAIAILLAHWSNKKGLRWYVGKRRFIDLALVVMIIILSFFCGLRTAYNDTSVYIAGFQNAVTPQEYLQQNPELTDNPLFYLFQSYFRHHIADNYHLFFVVIAFFTITCFVWFIKKYSTDFVFSMILFCTLLYLFPFAAMKQALAMAVLTIAVNCLLKKRYIAYYCLVFVAMLIHTYAIVFVVLPVFVAKPWTTVTYIAVGMILFVLVTFETSITKLLEYAEDLGKEVSAEQLLSEAGMNMLRVSVYAVPVVVSFLFQKWIVASADRPMSLMINMSIIGFLIVCMGAINAANMFGRSATYFIFGTIVALPWMIRKIFEPVSARWLKIVAVICYFSFFMYDSRYFFADYRAISFADFLRGLF